MATIEPVEKEIAQYLRRLSVQQKEVVLSVVKTFAGEENRWNDEAYITEMNRRFAELESGEIQSFTLDELESGAREAYRHKKRNRT